MCTFKRGLILVVVAVAGVSLVMGQEQEMSIEEAYLREAIEMMIIRETSRASTLEQKMIALDYIQSALSRGSTNDEIRVALEFLTLEGTQNRAMENGRLVNNFPSIRLRAARYLGDVGNQAAVETLLRVIMAENEPMVLQEAIRSLGVIGLNENGDVIATIVRAAGAFHTVKPDDMVALSAVDAISKIAFKTGGLRDPNAVQYIIKIADGPYVRPVQERARQVMSDLRWSGSN
ncbi:MAG: HEAT repeat domain-containing protein [Treponema sp.]|jgi:hypothetical protein|nr:HEAT repeat domain-containing protein [Treponema sp.]